MLLWLKISFLCLNGYSLPTLLESLPNHAAWERLVSYRMHDSKFSFILLLAAPPIQLDSQHMKQHSVIERSLEKAKLGRRNSAGSNHPLREKKILLLLSRPIIVSACVNMMERKEAAWC